MTWKASLIWLCFAGAAAAQEVAQQGPALNAAISGVVRDRGTGAPLADYEVATDVTVTLTNNDGSTSSSSKTIRTTTDKQGSYRLRDLPPGQYRIEVRQPQHFGTQVTKRVTLAGLDLDRIDVAVTVDSAISGRVIDENKEPVPGMRILVVQREYYLGNIGYFVKATGQTNDRGEYTVAHGVEAGRPYLVLAESLPVNIPTHSEVPLNSRLRRRIPMRTWYPNSPENGGATAVTLKAGERREGVDIVVRKSPSYCVDGSIETPNGPTSMDLRIEPQSASSGASSTGGIYMMTLRATTAPDGKFRICDLYPDAFRFTATQPNLGDNVTSSLATTVFNVVDRDIHELKIVALPGLPIAGEVVVDGGEPSTPITVKAQVFLQSLKRTDRRSSNRVDIPGTFSFPSVLIDDYLARVGVNAPGLYVKDVEYGGRSVINESIRPGSGVGNASLRVVIGKDGAKLGVRVADKDGNPVPDMRVVIIPADVQSEGMLAAKLVSGLSDQSGQYTSGTLAPGKYYVAASDQPANATVESVDRLWRSRSRFKEIDLNPSQTAQTTLEPVKFE